MSEFPIRQAEKVVEGAKSSDHKELEKECVKGEKLPSQLAAPVVVPDRNVITFGRLKCHNFRSAGRESRRTSEVGQPRGSKRSNACDLYTSCEAPKPNSNKGGVCEEDGAKE
ncbi:hypothetical protein KFK09_006986 [Dendrobium nobile]|uniref:Uncharacterized protein n=1 Tax=Dendrobium nobile TaxID=94219 RepID=A0A8T3BV28_DENNO|nr:hypothetical protein KFK09_006986 [Dendrobium nobile]